MYSLWQYLRERSRDAILSGIQDAIDVVEQGVDPQVCFEAASQLKNRLAAIIAAETSAASPGDESSAPPGPVPTSTSPKPPADTPQRPNSVTSSDMSQRLEQAKQQMSAGQGPGAQQQRQNQRPVPPPRKRPGPSEGED